VYSSFNARAAGLCLSAEATINLAASSGFEGVDLLVRDLVDSGADPRELRARMDDRGLRGGAWPLPVSWRGDSATFARDLERLPRLAEAAATLGLTRTGTWVLPETPERTDSEAARSVHRAATVAMHIERLGAIARVLDQYGSRFGLEVIGVESFRTGRGDPFIHRLADLDATLGALGNEAPNFGILLDVFHLYAAGEPIEAGLAWGVERVVWVHVADLPAAAHPDRESIRDDNRGLPGENGAVDSPAVLRRLADLGYDGPVSAEPMAGSRSLQGKTPEQAARLIASALHSVWPLAAPGGREARVPDLRNR
jgi:sugar phosphate isomerase/epimerase